MPSTLKSALRRTEFYPLLPKRVRKRDTAAEREKDKHGRRTLALVLPRPRFHQPHGRHRRLIEVFRERGRLATSDLTVVGD